VQTAHIFRDTHTHFSYNSDLLSDTGARLGPRLERCC